MKKRIFSCILSLVLMVGMLPATVFAAGPEAITLKVWACQEDQIDGTSWLMQMEQAFELAHPEYRITWDNSVCAEGDAATIVGTDPIAAADVFLFYSEQMNRLLKIDALLSLTDSDVSRLTAQVSESMKHTVLGPDGKYYGFPVSGNTWFLFYNKSLLSEADVTSFETMLEKGKVAFEFRNSWFFPAFYFANGCTMFGKTGADVGNGVRFNGAKGTAVTLRLIELVTHPNFMDDINGYGYDALRSGEVAAFFSGSWNYNALYEALGDDLGAAQLPTITIGGQEKQMKAYLGSYAVGVNANTTHEEAAREFARFLSSEEAQLLRWELRGVIPAAASLAQEPSIQANAAAKAQMDAQKNTSVPQPSVKEMELVWSPVSMMATRILFGDVTAENAAERTEEWNAEMNGGENPPPFTDVPEDSFYAEPVLWALDNGITTGATDTTFNPDGTCLRAQVVTFLHRAAQCPAPTSDSNPFADVARTDFFYDAVLWAVEEGITNGVSATEFGSYANCNRAAVVTFLWRAAGSPEPMSTENPFSDVHSEDFYYKAVLWAVENGITNGLSPTEFGPTAVCNRAQVVTFLYRAFNG